MEGNPYVDHPDDGISTNGNVVAVGEGGGSSEAPAAAVVPAGLVEASPPLVQMPVVHIERQVYSQQGFFHRYPPMLQEKVPLDSRAQQAAKQAGYAMIPSKEKCKRVLNSFLPSIPRMRHYQWRQWFVGDMVAGLTLGTIHIPQCLGYSAIVQVNPAFGLYSSFFPIFIYFVFGSSHGISIGTVAVMSLLARDFVTEQYHKYLPLFENNATTANAGLTTGMITTTTSTAAAVSTSWVTHGPTIATTTASPPLNMDCTIAIAVTATFIIGCMQLFLGICRLGIVSTLMSTPFNSAYMTATAIVTAVSQVPPAFGYKIDSYPGLFTLPFQVRDILVKLPQANPADVIASLISIAWLVFIKEFINPRYRKKLPIPIPAELVVVIVGTGISYGANLKAKYDLKIVNEIPLGFPKPAVPTLLTQIDGDFFVGCITMTIVACVECLTMAKILARKYRYHIDANQEFMAYGLVNFISSFFHVFPTAQSPPRTMIFDTTGGKTQLASLWSAALVLIVIVGVGPLFQNLPKACLASIIIVGVFPLLKHVKELKFYWKVQKWDFVGWILTCLSVLVLDLAVGLGVGIGWNLLIILAQSVMVQGYTEESTNEPDIFLRSKAYYNTRDIEGIRIFRFESDLFFANAESFKNQLFSKTVNPHKLLLVRKKAAASGVPESTLRRRSTATKPDPSLNQNNNNNVAEDPKKVGYITRFGKLVKGKLGRSSPTSYDVTKNESNIPMTDVFVISNKTDEHRDDGGFVNQAIEVVPSEYTEIPADAPTSPVKTVTLVEPGPPAHPLTQPLNPVQEQLKEEERQRKISTSSISSANRQRTSVVQAGSAPNIRVRTSSTVSWNLTNGDKADKEHTVLAEADFSATDDESDDIVVTAPVPQYPRRGSLRNSFSRHHDEDNNGAGPSSEMTLSSFYRRPDIDFVAIDEDREQKQINEEVEEIRSLANVTDGVLRPADIHTIILDCSPIAYIDFNGLLIIRQLFEDYRDVEIRFLLGACGRFMLDKLKTSAIYEEFGQQIYPTVFDAVMAAQAEPADSFFTSHGLNL